MTGERVERVAAVVLLAAAVVLLVAAVVDRDPWRGVSAAVLVAAPLVVLRSGSRRRARSSEAAGRWDRERVAAATAGKDGEVAAVRALRRADPDLSLADAVELVRESRRS